jgi:hypothetical protein
LRRLSEIVGLGIENITVLVSETANTRRRQIRVRRVLLGCEGRGAEMSTRVKAYLNPYKRKLQDKSQDADSRM